MKFVHETLPYIKKAQTPEILNFENYDDITFIYNTIPNIIECRIKCLQKTKEMQSFDSN